MAEKEHISASFRFKTWWLYEGNRFDGECWCCGDPLSIKNFVVGHVLAEAKGGELEFENVRPICSSCNLSMHTETMTDFMTRYGYTPHSSIWVRLRGCCGCFFKEYVPAPRSDSVPKCVRLDAWRASQGNTLFGKCDQCGKNLQIDAFTLTEPTVRGKCICLKH